MDGLKLTNTDILRLFFAIMVGDALNTINIKRRSFENAPVSVDALVKEAQALVQAGIEEGALDQRDVGAPGRFFRARGSAGKGGPLCTPWASSGRRRRTAMATTTSSASSRRKVGSSPTKP
jgi:hypothetical protein